MENLLYYPYINIPASDWAARALIYYDRIGSITPQRYFYGDFDPYMRQLLDNGLVQAVNPMTVLHDPWRTCRQFSDYMSSPAFDSQTRAFRISRYRGMGNYKDNFAIGLTRIHEDKFDHEIFYQLLQMGLAYKGKNDWYHVERTTADELMTFLASVIGAKLDFQPATDQELERFKVQTQKKEFQAELREDGKRQHILNELIPFPEEIDLLKLRGFKDKHRDLLKAFKNRIELIVLNPSIEINTPFFNENVEELKLRKDELSAKMNESKLGKIILGTVCGILGGAVGMVTAGTLGGALAAAPGFANAVYTALQIENPESVPDQSGLKYLALIDKRVRKQLALT